jgi:hypothetical protein
MPPVSREETELVYAQVERVLNSATFRQADVLRRLLRFLAERALSGEAEQLKEYTIGLALGKPPTYDPRHDSAVRIQVGRLRQKLGEYYREEGKDDPILLDLPKGQFNVKWEAKPRTEVATVSAAVHESPTSVSTAADVAVDHDRALKRTRLYQVVTAALLIWATVASIAWWQDRRDAAMLRQAWTPELQELWNPFLRSNRPLLIATASPLFVGFSGSGFFRDQAVNSWEAAVASPKVQAIRKALGSPAIMPRYYYAGAGETTALFHLGKLLNFTGLQVSMARSDQISWQQMVDNNVLFIGPPRTFGDQLHKLPVDLELVMKEDGIHELAKGRDQVLYADAYPSISNEERSVPDDGEVYALISRMPGPLGAGDVQAFNSNHSPGTLGAIQWFTSPTFANQLTSKLRRPDGTLPRYFQLVLRVKYRDAVPTDIAYVTHRELHADQSAVTKTAEKK